MTNSGIKITALQSPIVKIEYPDECVISLEMAKDLTRQVYGERTNSPMGIIHIAGNSTTIEEGVREYLAERSRCGAKLAEAFVIKNLNQRILANFYLRIFRPGCPSEVFSTEDEAFKWVKMYCAN